MIAVDIKPGQMVCIRKYDGQPGIRFGVVKNIYNGTFLVEMQEDREGNPIHYNQGYYRSYKANKISPEDIVLI